ncbi:hypothetical protein FRC10_003588 [Ceratobasidium sp. 414]|nr:hypothetical protein FRC10_003588 [Ceratobasidium sp. 414]
MGLSRPARIKILLAIDSAFFFVELVVGALQHSALSASGASAKYSYGWHRAEILAALINGVFLLALCFSIFMEAIERFFSTPEHSHDHGDEKGHAEAATSPAAESTRTIKPIAAVPTESTPLLIPSSSTCTSEASTPRQRAGSSSSLYGHPVHTRAALVAAGQEAQRTVKQRTKGVDEGIVRSAPVSGAFALSKEISSRLEEGLGGATRDPAAGGEGAVEVVTRGSSPEGDEECEPPMGDTEGPHAQTHPAAPYQADHDHDHDHDHDQSKSHSHTHSHGHSHGSMNMRALVLHVVGDALGNVGVIATGLIIWLSDWPGKYYCDPIISLVITAIIFSSALPLVKSTASILLQAVPPTLSLPHLRRTLNKVPGVLAIHELHVWQLSEVKSVASVHLRPVFEVCFMLLGSTQARYSQSTQRAAVQLVVCEAEVGDRTGKEARVRMERSPKDAYYRVLCRDKKDACLKTDVVHPYLARAHRSLHEGEGRDTNCFSVLKYCSRSQIFYSFLSLSISHISVSS